MTKCPGLIERTALPTSSTIFLARAGVLLVGHLLHPVHDLAVQLLLDGDMRHCGVRRCAVPVLLARRTPQDVAGPKYSDGSAPALNQTEARRHDERLPE